VATFPATQLIAEVRVPTPEELIAQKIISLAGRSQQPKGDTDRRDLKLLLLAYPALKSLKGPVADRIKALGPSDAALTEWARLVATDIQPEDEVEED